MKVKQLVAIVSLVAAVAACGGLPGKEQPAKDKPDEGQGRRAAGDGGGDPDPDMEAPEGTEPSDASVTAARYDADAHALVLTLEYDGCGKIAHTLVMGACAESYPMQCGAQLYRPKGAETTCDMLVTEELTHALPDTFDDGYVSFGGSVRVLVDRDGSLLAMGHGVEQWKVFDGVVETAAWNAGEGRVELRLEDELCRGRTFRLVQDEPCQDQACSATLRFRDPPADAALCEAFGDLTITLPVLGATLTSGATLTVRWTNDRSVSVQIPEAPPAP